MAEWTGPGLPDWFRNTYDNKRNTTIKNCLWSSKSE